jgi:hypothetical protein
MFGKSSMPYIKSFLDANARVSQSTIYQSGFKLSKVILPSKAASIYYPWSSLLLSHLSSPASPHLASAITRHF